MQRVMNLLTFWPQYMVRFEFIVSRLFVPSAVAAPQISVSHLSSVIVAISSLARCKACLTPIGLLMNAVVGCAAYSGNLVTSLTSLWKRLAGSKDDKNFAIAPIITGR